VVKVSFYIVELDYIITMKHGDQLLINYSIGKKGQIRHISYKKRLQEEKIVQHFTRIFCLRLKEKGNG